MRLFQVKELFLFFSFNCCFLAERGFNFNLTPSCFSDFIFFLFPLVPNSLEINMANSCSYDDKSSHLHFLSQTFVRVQSRLQINQDFVFHFFVKSIAF